MRAGVAVGLLCLLLAPWWGTHVNYGWERWRLHRQVRAQVVAGLPDSALVLLRFSFAEARQQLRWERSDEFVLDGHWYDVVRQRQQGDTLLLWCLPDQAESALEHAHQQHLASLMASHPLLHKSLQRLWLFFMGLFWKKSEVQMWAGFLLAKNKPAVLALASYVQPCYSPSTPPPELALSRQTGK